MKGSSVTASGATRLRGLMAKKTSTHDLPQSGRSVVDRMRSRVYDSRYLVTTYAPRGRASHLRSSASTWTRANVATAFELRPHAVVDHITIHEQWRPPLEDDRSGSAAASPRGAGRSAHDQRSQPPERVDVMRLRRRATSQWRYGDVAPLASCPWQGTTGVGAEGSRDPRARREGRDLVPHVRCAHPHRREGLNSPRSSPGGRPHRPPSGALYFFPHTTHHGPDDPLSMSTRPHGRALTIRKGRGDGHGYRFRSISHRPYQTADCDECG
jgi:hypothetical protein